jgi:hypothetical protein
MDLTIIATTEQWGHFTLTVIGVPLRFCLEQMMSEKVTAMMMMMMTIATPLMMIRMLSYAPSLSDMEESSDDDEGEPSTFHIWWY